MSERKSKRVTVRVDPDTYKHLEYWAARKECSISEYLLDAINEKIAHENGNYDLPKLEVARLNQLVDTITVLSSDVQSLESIIISGFDSLLGLVKGDNYLLESEDGEI